MKSEIAFTPDQLKKTISLFDQKEVTWEQFQVALDSGLLADLFEATGENKLGTVGRGTFRLCLGLKAVPDSGAQMASAVPDVVTRAAAEPAAAPLVLRQRGLITPPDLLLEPMAIPAVSLPAKPMIRTSNGNGTSHSAKTTPHRPGRNITLANDVGAGLLASGGQTTVMPVSASVRSAIPTWRTAHLGRYGSSEMCREILEGANFSLSDTAKENLSLTDFVPATGELIPIRLVLIAPADLGFTKGTVNFSKFSARAQEQGYGLCPSEMGPTLRHEYVDDQPVGELIIIASKETKYVFEVSRDEAQYWLNARINHDAFPWKTDTKFAFVQRQ